ncbi:MAG: hypothetical protein KDA85_17795, partial [Planctomycetaceae bacterium]|nr:hypothetical protein [Planctomycetaceae bacterium]
MKWSPPHISWPPACRACLTSLIGLAVALQSGGCASLNQLHLPPSSSKSNPSGTSAEHLAQSADDGDPVTLIAARPLPATIL